MKNLLLIIALSQLMGFIWLKKTKARSFRLQTERFRLFEVRDRLVSLVRDGRLQEDEFLFQYFYMVNNLLIKHSKHLNFRFFLKTLRNDINATSDEIIARIERELERKNDPEVSKTIVHLYRTIADMALSNSYIPNEWASSLLVRFAMIRRAVKHLPRRIRVIFGALEVRWSVYLRYSHALQTLENTRLPKVQSVNY